MSEQLLNPSDRGALVRESPKDRGRRRSTVRVLFVDDAFDARQMYGRYLQFRGLQVETACDGLEALQALEATLPDIIRSRSRDAARDRMGCHARATGEPDDV